MRASTTPCASWSGCRKTSITGSWSRATKSWWRADEDRKPAGRQAMRAIWKTLSWAAVMGAMAPGFAQERGAAATGYPEKPVRVIVAQGAGGNADTQARLFATQL